MTVSVLEVVPPAMEKPVASGVSVNPLTEVGVMAPNVSVIAGVEFEVATDPLIPLAVTTDTSVTVPEVEEVPAPIAVLKVAASRAETELSALNLGKVTAEGFARVNKLEPTVVAPRDDLPVAATNPVAPPSHWLYLFQLV